MIERYKQNFFDDLHNIGDFLEFEKQIFYKNFNKLCNYIDKPEINELIKKYEVYDLKPDRYNNQKIIIDVCTQLDQIIENIKPGYEILRSTQSSKFSDECGHNDIMLVVSASLKIHNENCTKRKLTASDVYNYFREYPLDFMFICKFNMKDCRSAIKYYKLVNENGCIKDIPKVYDNLLFFRRLYYNRYDNNPANTFRQAFILLMSAFDAAISDISTVIFGCSYSLLNDIMKLYEKDASVFVYYDKDCFNNVVELIRRRNIHLHNKGIVDKGYLLEKYPEKSPKYNFNNIYKLDIGQYAIVNEEYFYDGLLLLNKIIENIK